MAHMNTLVALIEHLQTFRVHLQNKAYLSIVIEQNQLTSLIDHLIQVLLEEIDSAEVRISQLGKPQVADHDGEASLGGALLIDTQQQNRMAVLLQTWQPQQLSDLACFTGSSALDNPHGLAEVELLSHQVSLDRGLIGNRIVGL